MRTSTRVCLVANVALALQLMSSPADARPATPAPMLPAPTGSVVHVSSEPQLQAAVHRLQSDTTIVVAPGTYVLTSTLWISGTFTNIGIRGATGDRDDVVLVGAGMAPQSDRGVPFGIWTGGDVQDVTIANLTIRDIYQHPIMLNPGTQKPRIHNVHLVDAGEQFIKGNLDSGGGGVNDGVVEYSVMEYTTTAPSSYTNGIDVLGGANWIIRNNEFRNIVAPPGQLAGPSVLMWRHARDTLTEGNLFVNCARGIAYGLDDTPFEHDGGIIRNNFFFRSSAQPGDVAIYVGNSPNTQVLNNTIFVSGTYGSPIEYRFPAATGVVIANNILDGVVLARDGATGTETSNVTGAGAALFVNAAEGDLHLAASASAAIDRGTTLSNVLEDWDGDARPQGIAYDIGADEIGAAGGRLPIDR